MPTDTDAVWIPHVRVSWGGTLGTPPTEIWTNTVRFKLTSIAQPSIAQLQAAADLAAPVIAAWVHDNSAFLCHDAALAWVKVNSIGTNGRQLNTETVESAVGLPVTGYLSSNNVPWYQTQALTLRTQKARGRAHAGRIFPPLVWGNVLAGSTYIDATSATAMATAFARCLFALNDAMSVGIAGGVGELAIASVFSPGSMAKGTPGLFEPIVSVVCDRVPDVQHRRTNRVARSESPEVALGP